MPVVAMLCCISLIIRVRPVSISLAPSCVLSMMPSVSPSCPPMCSLSDPALGDPLLSPESVSLQDMEEVVDVADDFDESPVLVPVHVAYPRPNLRPPLARVAFSIPPLQEGYTRAERESFVASSAVSDRVRAMLNEPYGKDNLVQCFQSEAALRHCLLPLRKSRFLSDDDWSSFRCVSKDVHTFCTLWQELAMVDCNALPGFLPDWESVTTICPDRVRMASAALFHFDGDAAALVRWIGGPHVHAHRDVPSLLAFLQDKLDPSLLSEIRRVFTTGIPRACNASSSEANFQEFFRYGNHASASSAADKAYQALMKDSRRGFVIPFDPRIIPYILNCHVTPQGMVDLDNPYKKPRPIFDSSFRPQPWCMSINDWTSMRHENPVVCVDIELELMTWIYNLRVSYPADEIYLADDDVSGAFRWLKYHPNLVAMHTSVQAGFGVLNTGGTFGGTTTPANWDLLARARRALAEWLWLHEPHLEDQAAPFLPPLQFSPPPSASETATFVPSFRDSLNCGVFDESGARRSPPFLHHVDDCAKADVGEYMPRAVAASTVSLYHVLGFPCSDTPNPLSLEKLDPVHTWERAIVGRLWNTRRMVVGMLPRKRAELLLRFEAWKQAPSFTLKDISELLGILENHLRFVPWARPWLFAIQNRLRVLLCNLWGARQRIWEREAPLRAAALHAELPQSIWYRITGIIARDRAQLLWRTKARLTFDPALRQALAMLHHYVSSTESPWEANIGALVPRDPQVEAFGDASDYGGGGFCSGLRLWFDVLWSPQVVAAKLLPSDDPNYVHINMLEFIVVILLVAAIIVAFDALTPDERLAWFPAGLPAFPVILERCDNTTAVSWSRKVTTSSPQGQKLLGIYSELLRTHPIAIKSGYIEGKRNILADFISRPSDLTLSHASRARQLFQIQPSMQFWRIFLPSPEFLQLLYSALFSPLPVVPPKLPPNLGHLVLAASTSSCSPVI
jgi:hypothetical protein